MRLKKEAYQAKKIPQFSADEQDPTLEYSELVADIEDPELEETSSAVMDSVETDNQQTQNKIGFDLNSRKLIVSLGIIAVMFIIPALIIGNSSNLLGTSESTAFSQAIVEPTGQVAGVNIDLGENINTDTTGDVQGVSTSDSTVATNSAAGVQILGMPIGTVMIAIGLFLVMVPVVILLKS